MAVLRERPYAQFNFLVDLGTGNTAGPEAGFQECSEIGMTVDVIEYRNGNEKENNVRKLPGLWNVLAGQLSIVGPRPHPDSVGPNGRASLRIRPGLTGLWRQAEDPTAQDVLDLYYVRNYSLWLDLQILFNRGKSRLHHPGSGWRREVAARQQVKHT